MQKDLEHSMKNLTELQAIYERAPFKAPVPENRPTRLLTGIGVFLSKKAALIEGVWHFIRASVVSCKGITYY